MIHTLVVQVMYVPPLPCKSFASTLHVITSGCWTQDVLITSCLTSVLWLHIMHFPHYKAWFTNKRPHMTYIGIGIVKGTTPIHGKPRVIELHDVLHSPRIGGHFFSILKVGRKGFQTTFTRHNAVIVKENDTLLEMKVHGNHYWTIIAPPSASVNLIGMKVSIEMLHARLGHLSWSSLQ